MLINSILVGMHKKNSRLSLFVWALSTLIIVLVPFHAFITVWFASSFGYLDTIRLWKELLLILLLIGSSLLLYRDRKLCDKVADSWLFRIGIIFCLWIGFMTFWGLLNNTVGNKAAGYGLIIDTRPVLFLLVSYIAACSYKDYKRVSLYIIVPAVVVVGFGLLQYILPADFLSHFGYSSDTIKAFQAVDNKSAFVRLQSTLRGPNPLGAYLVVVGLVALSFKFKKKIYKNIFLGSLAVVLFGTYSRSAWIGALFGLMTYALLRSSGDREKKKLYLASGLVVVSVFLGVTILKNNDIVQNVFFHTDENSTSITSSNYVRLQSLNSGLKESLVQPLGKGVGIAGPASTRNNLRPAHINENYLLQIIEEAGWIGCALFVAFLIVIIQMLLKTKNDPLACALVASFVATLIINMVSHAWADDTLAYLLFGITGIYLGTKSSTKSEKKMYT